MHDKVCDINDDSVLIFKSADPFTVDCNNKSDIALIVTIDEYDAQQIPIFSFTSDDESYTRELHHAGFVQGLMPSGDDDDQTSSGLMPSNGDGPEGESALVPDDGYPGVFQYYINGNLVQSIKYIHVGNDVKFSIILREDSFEVIEV